MPFLSQGSLSIFSAKQAPVSPNSLISPNSSLGLQTALPEISGYSNSFISTGRSPKILSWVQAPIFPLFQLPSFPKFSAWGRLPIFSPLPGSCSPYSLPGAGPPPVICRSPSTLPGGFSLLPILRRAQTVTGRPATTGLQYWVSVFILLFLSDNFPTNKLGRSKN